MKPPFDSQSGSWSLKGRDSTAGAAQSCCSGGRVCSSNADRKPQSSTVISRSSTVMSGVTIGVREVALPAQRAASTPAQRAVSGPGPACRIDARQRGQTGNTTGRGPSPVLENTAQRPNCLFDGSSKVCD
jgi:hypothetical protein